MVQSPAPTALRTFTGGEVALKTLFLVAAIIPSFPREMTATSIPLLTRLRAALMMASSLESSLLSSSSASWTLGLIR